MQSLDTLSTRETRIVNREQYAPPITSFEKIHGVRVRRPGRGNARRSAIRASVIGV